MQVKNQNNTSSTGDSAKVLIPVDFSTKGYIALKVGFELAKRLEKSVELIHASSFPVPSIIPQFPDDFNGMNNENDEMEEMEMSMEIHSIDEHSMDRLKKTIMEMQSSSELPNINFHSVIASGMPEEVIAEYCAVTPPYVIVMATRGHEKRKEELVGSVTAEIIDHSIAPVFTVPEDYTFIGLKNIVRICVFCSFNDGDLLAIEKLMAMFGNPEIKVYLFPATDKLKEISMNIFFQNLQRKLKEEFPHSEFLIGECTDNKNLRTQAEKLFLAEKIQMILAPNKKRNAISRLFHPGLAHKILYEIDFPMLVIPV